MKQITKMHGLGNDILIIDQPTITLTPNMIKQLGHRKQGIGFDQCITIKQLNETSTQIDIHNANGQQVFQCGNGLRCLMAYLANNYQKTAINIMTGNCQYQGKIIHKSKNFLRVIYKKRLFECKHDIMNGILNCRALKE